MVNTIMKRATELRNTIRFLFAVLAMGLMAGCAGHKPSNVENLCDVLDDEDWYEAALDSQERWGTPVHVQLAIMHQESRFVDDAKPARRKILGFIPGPRPSSAYGFAQAIDEIWDEYRRASGNGGADRDDFDDAMDFIGWYTFETHRKLGISKWDARAQYLAYHEGRGGYARGTFQSKPWLIGVANKVAAKASRYSAQYKQCKSRLDELDDWF